MKELSLNRVVGHDDVFLRYETDAETPPTVLEEAYRCEACGKTAETLAGLSLIRCTK